MEKPKRNGIALDREERYEFTWPGIQAAILAANTPSDKFLRPCQEESKHWDTTGNLYLEGDNLDALKLLQATHLNSVKMIYIDPPYNTGRDFVYRDSRQHSDWCSLMYPRLLLARSLLREDGVMFISIDDHEVDNLRKMAHQIFGESNFVAQICWKGRGGRQDSKHFAVLHEYILCYAKNASRFQAGEEAKPAAVYPRYDAQKQRNYKTQLARKWGSNSRRSDRPNLYYPILAPDNTLVYPMLSTTEDGCWRWGRERMAKEIEGGNVEFVRNEKGWIVYEKIYEPLSGEQATKKFTTWIDNINAGSGSAVLKQLFGKNVFDYPKPVELIKRLILMSNAAQDDLILDFFSGSATTAHAVMQLNAEDGGRRRFIMVQLPEPTDEKSKAYIAGYQNICEIGKERIRRAGELLKANHNDISSLDTGFRVLKIDDNSRP